jgi:DNA replication protein DnaC
MRSEEVIEMPAVVDGCGQRIQPADCDKHGAFDQRVSIIFGREFKGICPECEKISKAEREAEEQATAARDARIAMARKLGSALIPKRFADKTFDAYIADTEGQKKALRIATRYAERFVDIAPTGRCLLLLGKPGTGKTHLAVSIANEVMGTTTATAVYRTIGSVLQAIRATYDRSSDQTEAQILQGLIAPSLLVLDEIGVSKETPSDFELTTLFAIINGRYEELRPTIIVSNLEAEQLPCALGERCMDRLREGGGVAVKFDWESQRGREGF